MQSPEEAHPAESTPSTKVHHDLMRTTKDSGQHSVHMRSWSGFKTRTTRTATERPVRSLNLDHEMGLNSSSEYPKMLVTNRYQADETVYLE